ncbi:MAG: PAS domain-containing protein [Phycisphaerae bacterium]|nr:PAS domain-containing protein [Phycisphaerae bacterium]
MAANEDWLIERVLHYAKLHDYTRYTSTLKEAWRLSIAGLSDALVTAIDVHQDVPELDPSEDFLRDPCSHFGRIEAQRHRARGITLSMFLGLMKYYRQAYIDLVRDCGSFGDTADLTTLFVERFFDRVEIGFCTEWAGTSDEHCLAELRDTNRRLANEKNRFLTVFESLSLPVLLLDADGRVQHVNLAAAQVFEGALTPGASYYNPSHRKHEVSWLAAELAAFHDQATTELTFEKAFHQRGRQRHFEIKLCRMLDISDKFAGTLIILNDITTRRLAERKLGETNRELERKHTEMEQLIHTVSHDLKSPLVTISGFASYVQQDLRAGRVERLGDFIHRIQGAADRMKSLIEELLELSRIGRVVDTPTTVDVHELVHEIVALHQPRLAEKNIKLVVAKTLGALHADRTRLTQLFDNLITNAINHGARPEGSVIEIGLRGTRHELRYFVRDNGPGIPKRYHEQVFELFSRLDRETPGSGVGLAIAKRIVTVLGGRIGVESRVGAGATFWFALPGSLARSMPKPLSRTPVRIRRRATVIRSAKAPPIGRRNLEINTLPTRDSPGQTTGHTPVPPVR